MSFPAILPLVISVASHFLEGPQEERQRLLRAERLDTKWANLMRRAEIRPRPPYQTRHTACWNLMAQGNLAFIANQMRHSHYSVLVAVYGRWIDTESRKELKRTWEDMKNMEKLSQIYQKTDDLTHK